MASASILRRRVALLGAAAVVAATFAFSAPGAQSDAGTTLQRTVLDLNGDGRLEYAPGEALSVREELGTEAKPGRADRRSAITSFVGFTDFQLADEESVARGPWADKCGAVPTSAAFRPHETMVPHIINSNIRAASSIAAGPITGRPFDFGIQLGDAADNTQRNEVRWFIDLLNGGVIIDPDSGDHNHYEGPQGVDPWPNVAGRSILELANDPFVAPGLRRADGSPIPWYSVLGNHDAKIQGTVTNLPGWWEFLNAYSQGPLFVRDLAPDYQQELCADPTKIADPAFWMKVLARPGAASIVTADPGRVTLTRNQWMAEHLPPAQAQAVDPGARGSVGVPAGHGFLGGRCTDDAGATLDRLCYSYDAAGVHFIVLDTNPDEGLEGGNLDAKQLAWLERDLVAHSTRFYDAGGALKSNAEGDDSLIVVFSHHTRDTMDESFPVNLTTTDHATTDRIDSDGRAFAADFEAMLLRFPNVVMHGAGHTHESRVWPRPGRAADAVKDLPATGYWEINSSSHADWPHQSRTLEIVDNADGTLSIFGVVFDAEAPPKACRGDETGADATSCLAWSDDPTDETALGGPVKINEEYLAAVGREVGYRDPQWGGQSGEARGRNGGDRNVELLIGHPLYAPSGPASAPPKGGPPSITPRVRLPAAPEMDVPSAGGPRPGGSAFTRTYPALSGGTAKGVGDPAKNDAVPARSVRGGVLMLIAAAVIAWIYRARVRGWMLRPQG